MNVEEQLKKLYSHQGDFFMLILPGAIVLCDPPAGSVKEATVRLFMSARECERFRDWHENYEARVMRTTLVGVFNMIPRMDKLSRKQYDAPVRIEVCTLDGEDELWTIDTLHSIYELPS